MPLTPGEIASLDLQGAENARMIMIALCGLTFYEYLITLDEEIKYFWTGSWNMSRTLFLVNRYLPPAITVLGVLCFSLPHPSPEVCRRGVQSLFVAGVVSLGIVQAMLVIRVWYLFVQSRTTRLAMIAVFIAVNVLSLYFSFHVASSVRISPSLTDTLHVPGCRASRPDKFWRLYLPSLVLHTLLYLLTAFRALKNRRMLKEAPILKRLLRDGGFFYFVVFMTILFTTVGSFLVQWPNVNVPAIYSSFPVATTSIAASRVMLSIHSLAAKLGSDEAWLLNNVELSRVPWRPGATEGELVVDRFPDGFGDEEDDDFTVDSHSVSVVSLKMSRVGRWTDETW